MKKTTLVLIVLILVIAIGGAAAAGILYLSDGQMIKNTTNTSNTSIPDLTRTLYVMEGRLIPKSGTLEATARAQYAAHVVIRKSKPADFVVVLDPGHGGKDNGCSRDNIFEKDVNLAIAKLAETKLKDLGYQVCLTRDADTFINLQGRVDFTAEKQADAFVSIHQNSYEDTAIKGMETYCSSEVAGESGKELARLLHKSVAKQSGTRDRGIFDNTSLFVIRENLVPAALMELGFLTNEAERKNLANAAYQEKLATGIAEGVHAFLGAEMQK